MVRYQFSYWLEAAGSLDDCKAFNKALEAKNIIPEYLALTRTSQSSEGVVRFFYEVDPQWGTVEEIESLPDDVEKIVQDLPNLKITLECINEEDHAQGSNHAYFNKKHIYAVPVTTIKSSEDLLRELTRS